MTKLKIFVWPEFSPDYTNGLAFAIAETEKDAKDMIAEENGHPPNDWGPMEIRDIEPCAYLVYGGS